jgi:hypothetical protein
MNPSSDIEISDVTLPIAALLVASVFEQLDGSRIVNSSSVAPLQGGLCDEIAAESSSTPATYPSSETASGT